MSLSAVFPIDNTVGQELLYNIYDPSGAAVYDGVSAPVPTYTLTAADLTAGAGSEVWVDLPFIDPMTGAPGFPIDPALGEVWTFSISNEFDTLYIGVSGEALAVGGVWTTAGVSWYPLDGSNQNYYTTNCFMMRLNLAASSTGVSETELDAVLGQGNTSTKAATVGVFNAASVTSAGAVTAVGSNAANTSSFLFKDISQLPKLT